MVAGVNLAKAIDLLDERYGLGEALIGMILLFVCPGATRRSAGTPSCALPGRVATLAAHSPTSVLVNLLSTGGRPGRLRHHGRQGTASSLRLLLAAAAEWAKAAARRSAL